LSSFCGLLVRELERDNIRLKRRAERAEGIVELQKKSRIFWGSNWKRASRPIDGDGERAQGVVFSAIDLHGVGNWASQLLPMAHHQANGAGEVDGFLPLRDPGYF